MVAETFFNRFFRAYFCRANKVDCHANDLPNISETGWIEKKNDKYYLANIPFFADGLNIDDEVILKFDDDEMPVVKSIVSRQYASKSLVEYDEPKDFEKIGEVFKNKKCKVEGLASPHFDTAQSKLLKGKAIIASNLSKSEINDIIVSIGAKLSWHNTFGKS